MVSVIYILDIYNGIMVFVMVFKSWMKLFAFHIALIHWRSTIIPPPAMGK